MTDSSVLDRAQSPTSRRATSTVQPRRSRLRPSDVFGVGSMGLRTRKFRTGLTALGIAIGIAALVSVLGISASSKADLLAKLDALGTNRLQLQAGQSVFGTAATLPADAVAMIRRIGPVEAAATVTTTTATVRRTDLIPAGQTGGLAVTAATTDFVATQSGTVRVGKFLDAATEQVPAVVLGSDAAAHLGFNDLSAHPRVFISGHWFAVIGILNPIPLTANLDSAVFIGYPVAETLFATSSSPQVIYVRTAPDQVHTVQSVIAATANPQHPDQVQVSNPSDAIQAKKAVSDNLTALLLGLGGVALLVGGIGIANVMVIGVLERRTEIGVRRALGATKGHVRLQFLIEAVMLALLGGTLGVILGVGVTIGYARVQHITLAVPAISIALGVAASLVVGAIAGISPAARAARLAPADAIRPA